MIDLTQIGLRIAENRQKRGLTQKQLAELMSVSPQAVSKWERGLAFPDPLFLDELSEFLGITVEELLIGKNEKNPENT